MVEDVLAGVTVSWLSQVFSMDPKAVKAKLADCPPLHKRKAGYVYSLPVACRYLVRPAMTTQQMIKNMKATDLPPETQSSFWNGQLRRQEYEEKAGSLWRTEKVLAVFQNTFQTIKFTMQLWVSTLDQQHGLSKEIRHSLRDMVEALQKDIYNALLAEAKKRRTRSQITEAENIVNPFQPDPPSDFVRTLEEDIKDLV